MINNAFLHAVTGIGDSYTFAPTTGSTPDQHYLAVVQRGLTGFAAAMVAAGASGADVPVAPGMGVMFPVGSTVQLIAKEAVPGSPAYSPQVCALSLVKSPINAVWRGPSFTVLSVVGDVLTLDRAPPATPAAGAVVVGRGGGAQVRSRNYGISGNTSGQMLARVQCMVQREVPNIGVIYAGANDAQYATTIASVASASQFTLQAGAGANYQPGTYLTVAGVSAKILSVSTDTITLTAALAGGAPSPGAAVAIDTQSNIQAIGNSLKAAGVANLIVVGMHYMNFSSAGDTTSSEAYATLRGRQQAAATALGAQYVDMYGYMRARILAGYDVQGDWAWHIVDANTHPDDYGQSLIGAAILSAIRAQGWDAPLAA